MIIELTLADILQQYLWQAMLAFFRVGGLVSIAPIVGEKVVPVRVRLMIVVVISFSLAPLISDQILPQNPLDLGLLIFSEALTGLAIGAALRTMFWVLNMAGSIAAQSTSLAQLLGNPSVDPVPALGQILVIAGLALAAELGLHNDIIRLLALSYEVVQAGSWPDPRLIMSMGVENVSKAASLAFACVAPFIIGSLAYNLALGVINRAMPQLMVAFVGAPLITLASMALLAATAGSLLVAWWANVSGFQFMPGSP